MAIVPGLERFFC